MDVSAEYALGLRDATAWIELTSPTREDLDAKVLYIVPLLRQYRMHGFTAIADYFSGYLTKVQDTRLQQEAAAATEKENPRGL